MEFRDEGRVEGSLLGRVEFPLVQYLDPHSRGVARPKFAWPTTRGQRLDAFFMEFKPALMEWPAEAREGEPVEAQAQVTSFESDGVPFANGSARRTMIVAGYETIRAGEQTFDDAMRMEADSELSFGWLATVRVHETAWFARGIGLVRREERFDGRAMWLFRFGGGSKYEIADKVAPRVEMVADTAGPLRDPARKQGGEVVLLSGMNDGTANAPGLWSHLAICFERTGRRMQVSGVAIEFDK
jgi:hypothetical protein